MLLSNVKLPKDYAWTRETLSTFAALFRGRWNQRREAEFVTLLGHRSRNPRVHSVSSCGVLPASLPSRSGWSTPFTVPVPAPRVKVKTPEPALPTPQTCPPNGARASAPGEPVEEFSRLSHLHRSVPALLSDTGPGKKSACSGFIRPTLSLSPEGSSRGSRLQEVARHKEEKLAYSPSDKKSSRHHAT